MAADNRRPQPRTERWEPLGAAGQEAPAVQREEVMSPNANDRNQNDRDLTGPRDRAVGYRCEPAGDQAAAIA